MFKCKCNSCLEANVAEPKIQASDGSILYRDMDKYYFFSHKHCSIFRLDHYPHDPTYSQELIDQKVRKIMDIISTDVYISPVSAYYNSALDIYVCFNGYHRSCAYNKLEKNIPYIDNMPEAKLASTDVDVVNYKEELELIELGELDSTTITETQYKDILKLRNQWRKGFNE